MNTTLEKLEEIKRHGYRLDFGQAFDQAFSNFKKIALLGGLVILVLVIVWAVLYAGLIAIMIGGGGFLETMTEIGQDALSPNAIIVNLFSGVIVPSLIAPVAAGLLKMAHHAETNKSFEFSTAFDYFKTPALKEIILATFVITLFAQVIALGIQLVGTMIVPEDETWFKLFAGLFGGIVNVLTILTLPLIIFGNLNATQAISGSITLVSKRFWTILFLFIVAIIIVAFGLIGFCIGILFTMPLLYSLEYVIYRTAIPIEEVDEMDEIGTGFNE